MLQVTNTMLSCTQYIHGYSKLPIQGYMIINSSKLLFELPPRYAHQWRFDPGSRQRLYRTPSYSSGPRSYVVTRHLRTFQYLKKY